MHRENCRYYQDMEGFWLRDKFPVIADNNYYLNAKKRLFTSLRKPRGYVLEQGCVLASVYLKNPIQIARAIDTKENSIVPITPQRVHLKACPFSSANLATVSSRILIAEPNSDSFSLRISRFSASVNSKISWISDRSGEGTPAKGSSSFCFSVFFSDDWIILSSVFITAPTNSLVCNLTKWTFDCRKRSVKSS